MVLAVFVLILALLVNIQTRRFLYELDAYAQCCKFRYELDAYAQSWPGKGYWLDDDDDDQEHPDGREGTD